MSTRTLPPLVRAAVVALDALGAVSAREATILIGYWARRNELTADDIAVVLSHYGDRGEVPGTQPEPDGNPPEAEPDRRLVPAYVQSHRAGPR